jgi:hypothetical protein
MTETIITVVSHCIDDTNLTVMATLNVTEDRSLVGLYVLI